MTNETFKTLTPFRMWCQKVLPLVYDDSLSYYELLCKVVEYLNETMGDTMWLYDEFVKLKTFVDNYFDNLDVQDEINHKIDEMIENGQLDYILERLTPKHASTVKYFYIDTTNGDDSNNGESPETAFKTFERGWRLLNQGFINLGLYLMRNGTYYIPADVRVLDTCTLHLRNYQNSDCTIKVEDDGNFVNYSTHLSWYGSENHPLIIDIPVFRLDGGQFWCDYVHFYKKVGSNGCGCRLRWCEFTETSEFSHCNLILEDPIFHTVEDQLSQIIMRGGNVFVTKSITCDNQVKADESRIFELHASILGVEPETAFSAVDNKYTYFARTYSAFVSSRYDERNNSLKLATKMVHSSGYEQNDLLASELWQNVVTSGDADEFPEGTTYVVTNNSKNIAHNPFPRVACVFRTTRAFNNENYKYQEVFSWGTGYESLYAVRHAQLVSNVLTWSDWHIIRDVQSDNTNAITIIGDSLSSGYIVNDGGTGGQDYYAESWGAYLSRKLGCKFYISGRGGIETGDWLLNDTYGAEGMFKRLPVTPVYFIALGTNDGTHGVDETTFKTNYTAIINKIRQKAPTSLIICLKCWRTSSAYTTVNGWIDDVLTTAFTSDARTFAIDISTEVNDSDGTIHAHEYSGHFDSIGYRFIADAIDNAVITYSNTHQTIFRQAFSNLIRDNRNRNDGYPFAL